MKSVIQRILNGWTFTRVLFLGMGSLVIIQSAMDSLWFGVAFGGYFAAMGLFGFGCASGACYGGSCDNETMDRDSIEIPEIEFEEVKAK